MRIFFFVYFLVHQIRLQTRHLCKDCRQFNQVPLRIESIPKELTVEENVLFSLQYLEEKQKNHKNREISRFTLSQSTI